MVRRPAALLVLGVVTFCACKTDDNQTGGTVDQSGPVAPAVSASVLHEYAHDTSAFTQGLVYHDGAFFESTGRTGHSSLRQVEIATGRVLRQKLVGERYFAEGLALYGGHLYQLTWQDHVGFVYDPADVAQTGTFAYEGEGWGLTTDGQSLILSDGSNQLRFIDPANNTVRRTVSVMDGGNFVNDLNELEWVKGEVWANVWHTDRIARIDPATGRVKGWVELTGVLDASRRADPEAVPNGIAYDAATDRLWVTGKLWPALFEIAVPGVAGGGGAKTVETPAPTAP